MADQKKKQAPTKGRTKVHKVKVGGVIGNGAGGYLDKGERLPACPAERVKELIAQGLVE